MWYERMLEQMLVDLQNHKGLKYLPSERNEMIHEIPIRGNGSTIGLAMTCFLFILEFSRS